METSAAPARVGALRAPATGISEEMRSLFEGQKRLHDAILKTQQLIEEEEASYLEDTAHGNIVRGWDGFLDTKHSRKDALVKKIKPYTDAEHLFSSCCFYRTLGSEPTLSLVDCQLHDDATAGRRRTATLATGPTPAVSGASTRPTMKRTLSLERKLSSYGASSTSHPTAALGKVAKLKKKRRLERTDSTTSTASLAPSESGDLDDTGGSKSAVSTPISTSGNTHAKAGHGDFLDML